MDKKIIIQRIDELMEEKRISNCIRNFSTVPCRKVITENIGRTKRKGNRVQEGNN